MKSQKNLFIITAVSALLLAPAAFASDGTWNVAGNGSWTTAANWASNTIADGAGFTADFTGFSGNITLDGNRTIGKLIFSDPPSWYVSRLLSSGSGGSLTLAGATPTITVNEMGVQNYVNISSAILGIQGLTKDGVGTLVLSGGAANTLTGAITVNAGRLGSQDSASLQNVTGAITVASGATFDAKAGFGAAITNNFTLSGTGSGIDNYGALNIRENASLTGAITLAADTRITHDWNIAYITGSISGTNTNLELQTLQSSQGGFENLSAPISLGTGALTLTGIGTSYNADFDLRGSNSYTGGTLLKGGRVLINNSSALGNGTVTFVSDTSLTGTANLTHANAITVNSGVAATLAASASTTFLQSGAVTGTGTLTKSGLGTVTLSGGVANTFSGPIAVNAGLLGIQDSASLQNVVGAITVASGATFDAKAFYGAAITNNFTLSGNGSGINNYGALNIRENANLTGAITLAADTRITHDWNNATVSGSITGTNTNLELRTLQTSQPGFLVSAPISLGTGSLTLNGIGTASPDLTLSGNNTFTGGLIINNGVVQLNSVGALNSTAGSENAVTFGASTTGKLALNGRSYVIANLASNATPGSPVVENGNATAVTLTVGNSQNLSGTYAGVIQDGTGGGALSLTKSGTGTFTLRDGANSYTGGTTVNQGTLALGTDYGNNQKSTALGSGAVSVTGGAQLRLGGVGGGAVDFTVGNAITLDNGTIFGNDGVQHLTGGLTVAAGGGSLFVNWGGKDISLEGAVAGPGTLAINNQPGQGNGTVVFATGGTIGGLTGSGYAKVSSGQTLAVGSNGANTTFSGTLDGAGAITKTGTGTLTLTGTNYYSGATLISSGTLVVNGNQSPATGAVSVNGTLAGNAGTIGGNTTINSGGKLAMGDGTANSIGSETFTGTLAFASGSIFEWDLNAPTDDGASSNQGTYDQVINNNATKMSGTSVFNVVLGTGDSFGDAFWDTNKTWTNVFSGSGLATDLSAIFTSFSGGGIVDTSGVGVVAGQGSFSFNGSTALTWTAVPEPTSALAGLLITAGLLRRRRQL